MDIKRKIKGFATTTGKYIKKGAKAIGQGAKKVATGTKNFVTSPGFKKGIKGVAKTTGKYTLKGLGKGVELATRGTAKTINALVKNPTIQKIAAGAAIIGTSIFVPSVGVIVIGGIGLKYMAGSMLGKRKSLLEEAKGIINMGTVVTKTIGNKILSPVFEKTDKGAKNLGQKYQTKIDNIFR